VRSRAVQKSLPKGGDIRRARCADSGCGGAKAADCNEATWLNARRL